MHGRIPIHQVFAHVNKLPLPLRVTELERLATLEPLFSQRRNEILSYLHGQRMKQLRAEIRAARKAAS